MDGGSFLLCVAALLTVLAQQTSPTSADSTGKFTKAVAEGKDDAHAPSFAINDSLYLVFKDPKEMENVLAKVLQLWRNALVPYQALSQKVTIVHLSDTPVKGKVANQAAVKFRVTGASRLEIDVNAAKSSLHQTIQNAHMVDVENDPDWISAVGTSDKSSTDDNEDIDETKSFEIPEKISLAYKNQQERDDLLNKLLAIWKSALTAYQVTNVKASFIAETIDKAAKPSSFGTAHVVIYRINGQSSKPVDQAEAKTAFKPLLEKAHISQVIMAGTATESEDGSGDEEGGSGDDSASESPPSGTTLVSDTVDLTYSNQQERDAILNQILLVWKKTLSCCTVAVTYQIPNLKIVFDKETPNRADDSYIVNYHLTGTSNKSMNKDQVTTSFKQQLITAKVPGVNGVNAKGIVSGSGSPTISAGSGSATVSAGRGATQIMAGRGGPASQTNSGGNSQTISRGSGATQILAGSGGSKPITSESSPIISRGGGAAQILAGGGGSKQSKVISGGIISRGGGAAQILAGGGQTGRGQPIISAGSGAAQIMSGGGRSSGHGAQTISAGSGAAQIMAGGGKSSSGGAQTVSAGSGASQIMAGSGKSAGNGAQTISAGSGAAQIMADGGKTSGRGSQVSAGSGVAQLLSGAGKRIDGGSKVLPVGGGALLILSERGKHSDGGVQTVSAGGGAAQILSEADT